MPRDGLFARRDKRERRCCPICAITAPESTGLRDLGMGPLYEKKKKARLSTTMQKIFMIILTLTTVVPDI